MSDRPRPEQLSPAEKRELLAKLMRQRDQGGPRFHPLSFAQQRLWFLDRLDPSGRHHRIYQAFQLRGALRPQFLHRALQAIVDRHDSLRTFFVTTAGKPAAAVAPGLRLRLPVLDLHLTTWAKPGDAQQTEEAVLQRALERPFQLDRGPLLRCTLLRCSEDRHLLLVEMHHIISDAWSVGVLLRELAALYDAQVRAATSQQAPAPGLADALPPLRAQYPSYARWQRQRLQGDLLAENLAWWRQQLAALPALLELPLDRPRPPVQSHHGGVLPVHWPAHLYERVRELGRRNGASAFVVLLAAFQAFLGRLTGARDLAVGTPVAGRDRSELEGLIGFFINSLVLRANLQGDSPAGPGFDSFLRRTRDAFLGAFDHSQVPFDRLVEELKPERNLSYHPLYQVDFQLQAEPVPPLELSGLVIEPRFLDAGLTGFDLAVQLEAQPDGSVAGWVQHGTAILDRSTVERWLRGYRTLVESALDTPAGCLFELSVLTAAERHQLVREWNDTETAFEDLFEDPSHGAFVRETLLHRAFEAQAAAVPDAPALTFRGDTWSYRQLDQRANRLAHYLRRLGVRRETRVAVCLERSHELVVALYAVLKAGGAYVPVDPGYPAERLEFLLRDAAAPVLLTQERLLGDLGLEDQGVEGLCLDRDWPRIEQAVDATRAEEPPRVELQPENAAYVIYTSGSTGQPKGAVNRHLSIDNRLAWMQRAYPLDASDVVLQKTPFSFDVSVWEFFWPLRQGARLVMAEPGGHQDPAYLIRTVAAEGVTTMHFVPSMLQLFVDHPRAADANAALRRVFCSGEALPPELVQRFFERVGVRPGQTAIELHNLYGPTEAAVDVTYEPCSPGKIGHSVAIGRPVANTSVVVLDSARRPLPIGVAGELFLGGVQLARGYHRRPSLTAQRFVPDPLATSGPGSRLYATGDETRLLPDGRVEFLGRIDFQVKLRGLRIELGEIEAALRTAEVDGRTLVHEALVLVLDAASGEGHKDQRLVAYVQPEGLPAERFDAAPVLVQLRERLPEYMVPSQLIALDAWPLTANGKLDRKALMQRPLPRQEAASASDQTASPAGHPSGVPEDLEASITAIWRDVLGVDKIGAEQSFFDLGGHSLLLAQVQARLLEDLGRELPLVELFQHPTVRSLARHLSPRGAEAVQARVSRRGDEDADVAVIGVAGRFPGAADVDQLWHNLEQAVESIAFFERDEVEESPFGFGDPDNPNFVLAGGLLDDPDLFDADFFGYTPREAQLLDPQQRLFLEACWQLLERAGIDPARFAGRVGVFGGTGISAYFSYNLMSRPDIVASAGAFQLLTSSDKDFLPTRVSYKFNLRGPAVNVQTACSTSLVAAHLAYESLLRGECDVALAGGVSLRVPQRTGYLYQPGMILSPDGHCRAFDADAAGTILGSGVAVLAFKRLSAALADGDPVLAVIKGSAINNDGSDKVGFTAPSVDGQTQVITDALANAGVDARSIGYVEAHGTGTDLGDPIEVAALTQAYRAHTDERGFCALGSLKTNVGHLDTAAGAASLIKTVLSLQHAVIPASLHYQQPNPQIDFDASPFFVAAETRAWPAPSDGTPRRAGVSSFGIGGTNVHMVLEEPPARSPGGQGASGSSRSAQLLVLSARSDTALEAATERLHGFLEAHPEVPLADVAWTLQHGRHRFDYRRALVVHDHEDALAVLCGEHGKRLIGRHDGESGRPVAFLFPGQGAQYPGMGRQLYALEAAYRDAVDACAELLQPHLADTDSDGDIRTLLMPPLEDLASEAAERLAADRLAADRLRQTRFAQPALFVVEYALAQLWRSWGIEPRALIGHSIGEYVAACLAGVLTLPEALRLVAARGRLMQGLPAGAMLSVPCSEADLEARLASWRDQGRHTDVCVATINAPDLCVLAGPIPSIDAVQADLEGEGLEVRRLHTSHAFHSAMMEPVLSAFGAEVKKAQLQAPRLPFVSNVTGTWIRAEEATDAGYWVRHLRHAVRFGDGAALLLEDERLALIEVGPGRGLRTLLRRQPAFQQSDPKEAGRVLAGSLRGPKDEAADLEFLLTELSRLWLGGVDVDWRAFRGQETRHSVILPTYPFERKRHWVEPGAGPQRLVTGGATDRLPRLGDWVHVPAWRQQPLAARAAGVERRRGPWLVLAFAGAARDASTKLAETLVAALRRHGHEADVRLLESASVQSASVDSLGVDGISASPDAATWRAEFDARVGDDSLPAGIVDLRPFWSADHQEDGPKATSEAVSEASFHGPLQLLQAFAGCLGERGTEADSTAPGHLYLAVSRGALAIDETEVMAVEPERSALLGLLTVTQQENPDLACRLLDVGATSGGAQALAEMLVQELERGDELVVARRGRRGRWLPSPRCLPLPPAEQRPALLREQGVYLLTGGLGGVGLVLARYLAQRVPGVRLALLGRSGLPPRAHWDAFEAEHQANDRQSRAIEAVRELEQQGAEVEVVVADVADRQAMAEALAAVRRRFGALHGVIHAAGLSGEAAFRPLGQLDRAACEAQFRPKITGTRVLAELLHGGSTADPAADPAPDFVMVTSSISTVLGGIGFAAYAAANLGQDALVQDQEAQQQAREAAPASTTRWLSIDWDAWNLEAVAGTQLALTPEEGQELLDRVLAHASSGGEGHVVISVGALAARMQRWCTVEELRRARDEHRREAASAASGDGDRPQLDTAYVAPRSDAETALAAIWSELLGIDRIGIHDDFFELGGHSLLVTQLLTRIRDQLGAELEMAMVFSRPTVAELAVSLADELPAGTRQLEAPPIVPVPRDQPLRLSFGQERFWFLQRLDPESIAYNLPAAIRLLGRLDVRALQLSFDAIACRHEMLRTRFVERDGKPFQLVEPRLRYPLPVVDLSALEAARREQLVYALAFRYADDPFDLAALPLLRNCLLRLAVGEHTFLTVGHHIISDGWSGILFVQELGEHYRTFHGKQSADSGPASVEMPEALPLQYGDYAVWQRDWLQGEVLQQQIDFWCRQLEPPPPALRLPYDRPRVSGETAPAGRLSTRVQAPVLSKLRSLALNFSAREGEAQAHGITLFMILMAAYFTLLYRYSGQSDLAVGTPIANRHRSGTEGLVGLFINTLVLRLHLDAASSDGGALRFPRLVQQLQQVSLAAYDQQDLPFDELIKRLPADGGERRTQRSLFTTMLAFNHEPPPALQLPELEIGLVDLDQRRVEAMYDFVLGMTDFGDHLYVSVEYDRSRFDATSAQRFSEAYLRVLGEIATDAERSLIELPVLGAGERHQLLVENRRADAAWVGRHRDRLPSQWSGQALRGVYVLDPQAGLTPMGAVGELYVEAEDQPSLTPVPEGQPVRPRFAPDLQLWPTGVRVQRRASGELQLPGEANYPFVDLGRRARGSADNEEERRQEEQAADQVWSQVSSRQEKLSAKKKAMLAARLRGALRSKTANAEAAGSARPKTTAGASAPSRVRDLEAVKAALARKRAAAAQMRSEDSLLLKIQPAGEQPAVACVHAIAGDVTCYLALADHLGRDRPVYGLQAEGLDGSRQPLRRVEDMAARYLDILRREQPAGPYLLVGWSMGGVIALEMAQQLGAAGENVPLLVLLEPSVPGIQVPLDDTGIVESLARDLESALDQPLDVTLEQLLEKDLETQLTTLFEQVKRHGLPFFDFDRSALSSLFRLYKANVAALQDYRPQPYAGRSAVFIARERPPATEPEPSDFWTGGLLQDHQRVDVGGGHTSMLQEPHVRDLARRLTRLFTQAAEDLDPAAKDADAAESIRD